MKTNARKGQSLVETSLVLAAFLGLLLGMIGICQTLFVRQTFSERVHQAARWGAMHAYDPTGLRNIVLYGTAADAGATSFMGLSASEILVAATDCPGTQCRVTVAIPKQGIHSTEPVEFDQRPTDGGLSKP